MTEPHAPPGATGEERRGRPRLLLVAIVVVLLAAFATGAFLLLRGGTSEEVVLQADLLHPPGWEEQVVSDGEAEQGMFLKVGHEVTGASFTIRTILGDLPEDFDFEELADSTVQVLSDAIEGFQLVRSLVTGLRSYEALRVEYLTVHETELEGDAESEEQPAGIEASRTLLLIIPSPHQTFYLTLTADAQTFDEAHIDAWLLADRFVAELEAR